MPGHGVGGVPGNGFGGGIGSMHGLGLHGLFKNHHALTSAKIGPVHINTGPGGNVPAPKLPNVPMFKPAKPMPVAKIPNPPPVRQPKPKTSTSLGPLRSAATTRPSFARNVYS
jgi:hypothetical protein